MKSFTSMRANRSCLTIELSFWDVVRLLFGKEIMIVEKNEVIVLRHYPAYVVFNNSAGLE